MMFHTSAEKKSKELKTRLLKSEKNVKYVLLDPDTVSESGISANILLENLTEII